eukprot:scaffold65206_cov31-Tisochrysis_lutea.AAC.5
MVARGGLRACLPSCCQQHCADRRQWLRALGMGPTAPPASALGRARVVQSEHNQSMGNSKNRLHTMAVADWGSERCPPLLSSASAFPFPPLSLYFMSMSISTPQPP